MKFEQRQMIYNEMKQSIHDTKTGTFNPKLEELE